MSNSSIGNRNLKLHVLRSWLIIWLYMLLATINKLHEIGSSAFNHCLHLHVCGSQKTFLLWYCCRYIGTVRDRKAASIRFSSSETSVRRKTWMGAVVFLRQASKDMLGRFWCWIQSYTLRALAYSSSLIFFFHVTFSFIDLFSRRQFCLLKFISTF